MLIAQTLKSMISHFILNLRLCHSLGHDIGAECALFSSYNIINIHTFFINNIFFLCVSSFDGCVYGKGV